MKDKVLRHSELCEELADTYRNKNHDYGDSFGESFEKYGITVAMVRMGDKWNRLNNLVLKAETCVKEESINDTLLDLANYCLMTYIELEQRKEKNEADIKEHEENC